MNSFNTLFARPTGAETDQPSVKRPTDGTLTSLQSAARGRFGLGALAVTALLAGAGCAKETEKDTASASSDEPGLDLGNPSDSDGDGLNDDYETEYSNTDPYSADSDGDGAYDGAEVAAGTDPNDPADYPGHEADNDEPDPDQDTGDDTDTAEQPEDDADGDGMADEWEEAHSLTDPAADADNDGLSNLTEYEHDMNPNVSDTVLYHDTNNDGSFGDVSYGGVNVALGEAVSSLVSTPTDNAAYAHPASHLNDGDLSTQAYSATSSFGYCVEFESAVTLSSVYLHWGTYGTTWDPVTEWSVSAITDQDEVWTLAEGGLPGAERTLVALNPGADTVSLQALCVSGSNEDGAWTGLYEMMAFE